MTAAIRRGTGQATAAVSVRPGAGVTWSGTMATVAVTGELDSASMAQLARTLGQVAASHPHKLLVDLHSAILVNLPGAVLITTMREDGFQAVEHASGGRGRPYTNSLVAIRGLDSPLPRAGRRGPAAAATASSTASQGTEEASTPSEIQSVRRPLAATTPLCVMTSDLAGPAANSRRDAPEQDQTRLSGIGSRVIHRRGVCR
jgi:hypothetical protein